jgi:hypothetical protein
MRIGRETPTALPAELGSPQFSPRPLIALRAFFCCWLTSDEGGLPVCIETLLDWLLPALEPPPPPETLELPPADELVPPAWPLAEPRDAVPPTDPPADPLGVLEPPVELLPLVLPAVAELPRPLAFSPAAPLEVPPDSP